MITKVDRLNILKRDVENVLIQKKCINKKTNNTFDITRILGVVATTHGAENYISYTIPKIVKQINESGFNADIIIGLNNGFECPAVVDKIASISESQVIHLYTTTKIDRAIPAIIFDNVELNGQPYRIKEHGHKLIKNRIFFIHQKNGVHSQGKVRILLDIYQLLLDSIAVGWIPPIFTLTFDAETMFLIDVKDGKIDIESNGFGLLIKEIVSNSEIDILGARLRNALYSKQVTTDGAEVFLPEFSKLVPPIQLFVNFAHGKYKRYGVKPGGGTIGKTDVIISLLFVISKSYPGTIGEDVHATILANHAGFNGGICKDVVITNRCADMTDITNNGSVELTAEKQIYRWITAYYVLERKYGRKNIRFVAGYNLVWNIFISLFEIFKELNRLNINGIFAFIIKIKHLLKAISVSIKLKKYALKSIETFSDTGDTDFW